LIHDKYAPWQNFKVPRGLYIFRSQCRDGVEIGTSYVSCSTPAPGVTEEEHLWTYQH